MKDRKEEKKRMEKRKINPKRRKGVLFSIGLPSVNLKYNHIEQFDVLKKLSGMTMYVKRESIAR